MMSCVASEMIVSVPFASTTGTIVQKTPIGVKYMIVLMIFRQISFSESIKSRNGLPFSPMEIRVKPMITANTRTWSMFPSAKALTGFDGIRFLIVSRILLISVAWMSAVAISKETPLPRWIRRGMIRPTRLASAVVLRKYTMAEPVIFPVVRMFPMLQIPMTIEQKTIGKIIMFRAFVNASDQTGNSQDRCISSGKKKSGQDTKDQSGKDRLGDMLLVPGIKRLHYIVPSS